MGRSDIVVEQTHVTPGHLQRRRAVAEDPLQCEHVAAVRIRAKPPDTDRVTLSAQHTRSHQHAVHRLARGALRRCRRSARRAKRLPPIMGLRLLRSLGNVTTAPVVNPRGALGG
jgi:hypothetical protein